MMIIKMCKDYKFLFFFGIWIIFFFLFGLVMGIFVICEYMLISFIICIFFVILSIGLMILVFFLLVIGLILDMVVMNVKKEYELNLYYVYYEYYSRK